MIPEMLEKRLQSHGLLHPRFSSIADVVKHYGCIQAQDIPQAMRVLGSRVP